MGKTQIPYFDSSRPFFDHWLIDLMLKMGRRSPMACTPGRVKAVFKLRKEGKTWKAIGELFECCIQLVFHIRVDLGIIKSPEKPFTQIAYWVAQLTIASAH